MNRLSKWSLFGVGAVVLGVMLFSVACGTSSSSSNTTQMRVVDLSPDEQPFDLLIDNKVVLSDITYGVPTAFTPITSIDHDLKLNLNASPTNILDSPMEPFAGNTSYTYLVVGYASAGGGIRTNKLTDDHTAPTTGMFKLRFVNGSPNAGPVDVYIISPGTLKLRTDWANAKPTIGGVASNSASTYQMMASGGYQIFVTPQNDNSCLANLPAPPAPLIPINCLINLNGLNNTAIPAFQAGQNRTMIMLNSVPQVQGGSQYTTLTPLADLN